MRTQFNIAVFEGDGIGPEITQPCCNLMQQACKIVSDAYPDESIGLVMNPLPAGAKAY